MRRGVERELHDLGITTLKGDEDDDDDFLLQDEPDHVSFAGGVYRAVRPLFATQDWGFGAIEREDGTIPEELFGDGDAGRGREYLNIEAQEQADDLHDLLSTSSTRLVWGIIQGVEPGSELDRRRGCWERVKEVE